MAHHVTRPARLGLPVVISESWYNFIIRSLKIGSINLSNVIGSVAPVKGSPLLGQSFLSRFSSWSIDNRRQVLILR
jgi:predicted aspartyl protease